MGYQPLGKFPPFHQSEGKISFSQIRGGIINAEEIVLAGGTKGRIRSENYDPTNETGWGIFGDGNAEFNDVVVRGTIVAGTGSEVDWSYIRNVSIENADIVSLSFDKITAGSNDASLVIGAAGSISSANYAAGSDGFRILGTGNAEFNNVTMRGVIEATSGELGDLDITGDLTMSTTGGQISTNAAGNARMTLSSQSWSAGAITWIDASDQIIGLITAETDTRMRYTLGPGNNTELLFVLNSSATGQRIVFSGGTVAAAQIRTGGAFEVEAGSASAPGIGFIGDPDTGIFRPSADTLGFATNGTLRFQIDPNLRHPATGGPLLRAGAGDEGFPTFTFHNDSNTGIFRVQPDNLGFSAGGTRFGGGTAAGMYTLSGTTGSAANVHLASGGLSLFQRSTSARKYKTHITDAHDLAEVLLQPVKFYREDDDAWYYGFIADDLAEQDPLLGTFDPETGEIENYDQRAVLAVLAAKVNRLEARIEQLEQEVARLRGENGSDHLRFP